MINREKRLCPGDLKSFCLKKEHQIVKKVKKYLSNKNIPLQNINKRNQLQI